MNSEKYAWRYILFVVTVIICSFGGYMLGLDSMASNINVTMIEVKECPPCECLLNTKNTDFVGLPCTCDNWTYNVPRPYCCTGGDQDERLLESDGGIIIKKEVLN